MLLKSARTLQNRVKLGKSFGWGIFSKAPEAKPESLTVPETSSVPIPEPSALIEPISFVNPRIELMKTQFEQFNGYLPEVSDVGNLIAAFQPNLSIEVPSLTSKLFSLNPSALYHSLDEFSREATIFLAENAGFGYGFSILALSLAIKAFFVPIQVMAQVQGIKTKLLSAEMKEFQDKMKKLSRSGEYGAIKEEREKFNALRRSHGISTSIQLLTLTQIPFLMTWFLSLRYMLGNADLFPALETDGFLWFQNLADHDPYFILPFLSALCSSINISKSSATAGGMSSSPMAKYMKFMKFMPFLGFPILMYFPAGLNLYWVTVAGTQLVITTLLRTRRVKKFFGVDGYLPGTYLYKLHKKSKEGPPNFTSEQLKGLSAKNAEQAGALNQANTSNNKKHEEKPVSEAPKPQNPNVSFQKPKKK